ncbi:Flp family type IVb pilin [Streptomyces sp. KR80]|uniref:Flp family type IVb pilin n=1 Tax=Streptomyces sp. KR80 TaxID=3457426 RepID=UPI003FD50D2B
MSAKGGLRNDQGATAVEYIGMIVVVIAIMLAVTIAGIGTTIGKKIACAISSVGGGSCSTDGTDGTETAEDPNAKFEPATCQTHAKAGTAGGKVKVSFRGLGVEFGGEYGFEETTIQAKKDVNKDGKIDKNDRQVQLTFTDTGSVQGKVEPKAKVKIGDVGKDKVELGAGLSVTKGDTWVFDSADEANQFRHDIERFKALDRVNDASNLSPIVGGTTEVASWFGKGPKAEEERLQERLKNKLGERHITTGKISAQANATAGLQFGPGLAAEPGSGNRSGTRPGDGDGGDGDSGDGDGTIEPPGVKGEVGVNISLSGDVTWTKNDIDGTKSYTYSATAKGGAYAKGEAGPVQAGGEAAGSRTGAYTITTDQKTGELRSITMTQTTETSLEGSAGLKDGPDKGKGSGTGKGRSSDIDVVTNTISFDPGTVSKAEADRIKRQLFAGGGALKAFEYMFTKPPVPTTDPGASDPFGHLLYEKGVSSKTSFSNVTDASEVGLDINLGVAGIGGSVTSSSSEKNLEKAEFLGAPKNGRRAYVPFSYCAN